MPLDEDLLAVLRCPNQPTERLVERDDRLVCTRCDLRFKIENGLPVLVVELAELPPGCRSLADLPCRKEASEKSR